MDNNFDYSFAYLDIPKDLDFEKFNIKWTSLTKYLETKELTAPETVFDEINVEDVLVQKNIESSTFLQILAYLSENHTSFIERLFVTKDVTAINAYKVNICLCGIWTEYIIDDYFPFIENLETGELEFLYSSIHGVDNSNALWIALLEKAYAKAYGGYCAIGKQSVLDSIEEFTGASTFSIDLEPLAANADCEDPEKQ
jgi:hypothetical protein